MSGNRFILRSEIDIHGNKLMMENMNSRKEFGVKILNTYRIFRNIRHRLNYRNPFVNGLIALEIGNYIFNEVIKTDNDYISYWRQNNKADYVWNCGIYFTLGRLLYITHRNLFLSIIPIGVGLNYLDYAYIKQWDNKIADYLNFDNVNLISEKNIIPKLFLAFSLTSFLSYFLKKKIWTLKSLKFNRQNFTMFFGLFFISKFLKYMSYLTSESIKYIAINKV
jgi:hypothetical protein